jgi:hypothetical protein
MKQPIVAAALGARMSDLGAAVELHIEDPDGKRHMVVLPTRMAHDAGRLLIDKAAPVADLVGIGSIPKTLASALVRSTSWESSPDRSGRFAVCSAPEHGLVYVALRQSDGRSAELPFDAPSARRLIELLSKALATIAAPDAGTH